MMPPDNLIQYIGGTKEDFVNIGEKFLIYLKLLCNLEPNSNVLDVGSGCGRMAIPIIDYLGKGHYEGLEIDPKCHNWCQENLSSDMAHFTRADIRHSVYNPEGQVEFKDYKFPYENGRFDVVLCASLFTHLQPPWDNYMNEIKRTMKKGGRLLLTAFVDENTSDNPKPLRVSFTKGRTDEEAVCVKKSYVESFGFELKHFYFGRWSGRPDHLTFQDLFVFEKT